MEMQTENPAEDMAERYRVLVEDNYRPTFQAQDANLETRIEAKESSALLVVTLTTKQSSNEVRNKALAYQYDQLVKLLARKFEIAGIHNNLILKSPLTLDDLIPEGEPQELERKLTVAFGKGPND